MKKYVAMIRAMILVIALASPALAADEWMKEFKTSSLIQIWSVWENKPDFGINATNQEKTRRGLSERINFFLEWGNSKYVRGVIGFEADSTDWGENPGGGTDGYGTGSAAANKMGSYRADQVQLEIKNAYLDFTIPNTPVSISAGMQPFFYGGRLFQAVDAPGIIVAAKFAPHKIEAFWWRENETDRYTYQVNDTYGLQYSLSQKPFNVYAYGAYKNDQRQTQTAPTQYSDNPYWIGVGGGFRPGNWNFSGQFVYLGGKKDYVNNTPTRPDQDYAAWVAEILAQYKIGPGLFVALEGFYATGNDADSTSKINLYQTPYGSEASTNFGRGRTVFFWRNMAELGNQHQKQLDFGGLWYGRANVNYSPLPWLNLSANYLYIGDTSKGTADGVKTVNSPTGARKDKDEDFVGHEINLITKLKIYQNFTYNIGLGVFLPGAVYSSATQSAENAWAVNTGMQLVF